jgi:hypothetical protein
VTPAIYMVPTYTQTLKDISQVILSLITKSCTCLLPSVARYL